MKKNCERSEKGQRGVVGEGSNAVTDDVWRLQLCANMNIYLE